MYCPKCGTQIREGAKFCNKCGNMLSVDAVEVKAVNDEVKAVVKPDNTLIRYLLMILSIIGILSFFLVTMSSSYYEIVEDTGSKKIKPIGDSGYGIYGIDSGTDDDAPQYHEFSFGVFVQQSYRETFMLLYYFRRGQSAISVLIDADNIRMTVNIILSIMIIICFLLALSKTIKSYSAHKRGNEYLSFKKVRSSFISVLFAYIAFWSLTKIPIPEKGSIGFKTINYSFMYYFIVVALVVLIKVTSGFVDSEKKNIEEKSEKTGSD